MSLSYAISGTRGAAAGLAFCLAGLAVALVGMFGWASGQQGIAASASTSLSRAVLEFFGVEAAMTLMVVAGIYILYAAAKAAPKGGSSVLAVIAEAFSSRKTMRIAVVIGAAYAAVFSVLSGTLVYQPTVNFASVYGVTSPGWSSAVCCGDFGSVPELNLYVSPSMHLGVQILPLSLLMLLVVPALVTLNVALAVHSLRQKAVRSARWAGSIGAFLGLVTGCPTCAGYFLLSAVGGLGVTAFTFVLDPYQTLFIALSVPLLVAGPFLTAYGVKKANSSYCPVP